MNDTIALAADLAREFEGCRLRPYLCPAGYWTIGWGNRALANGAAVTQQTPAITQTYADALLQCTLVALLGKLRQMLRVSLPVSKEAAVLDLQYNIGTAALASSTLLRLLNAGRLYDAGSQILLWNHIHKNGQLIESSGLTRRRQAEWHLFMGLSGQHTAPAQPPKSQSSQSSTDALNAASLARATENT